MRTALPGMVRLQCRKLWRRGDTPLTPKIPRSWRPARGACGNEAAHSCKILLPLESTSTSPHHVVSVIISTKLIALLWTSSSILHWLRRVSARKPAPPIMNSGREQPVVQQYDLLLGPVTPNEPWSGHGSQL